MPSHPTLTTDDRSIVAAWTHRLVYSIRATAFWSAALLPLFVIGALAVGEIGQYPAILAGALLLNVVCAVVGHDHAPGER
jgi:preprotein translocase subunit SecY